MQIDRGFIKWMPFDSVVPTKKLLESLASKKNNIKMPILSEEQIINNENQAVHCTAFYFYIALRNNKRRPLRSSFI